ncbi:hypothetical protein CSW98_06925 [Vibrio sp. HA2012]|uniref:DUF5320 domain-containing protein n=1 Tax=Vibrio sp. HA2012 TaxID=1971595 RepID=UPI000C2C4CE8|nr:DUF5320 domain-containing protein [Vibrio sp. HA2012]PJC86719.1 hypothetical protein CSW98_06925 [Vibrio sp. HA2012]
MPGYDKTGPMGNGPKTGRGLGVNVTDNQVNGDNTSQCKRMRQRRNIQDGFGGRGCGRRQGAGSGRGQSRNQEMNVGMGPGRNCTAQGRKGMGQGRRRAGLRGNGMGQGRIGFVDAK